MSEETTPTDAANINPGAEAEESQSTVLAGADAAESKEDTGGEQPAAPEKYEDFTYPEGLTADTERLDRFTGFAKEHNLSQESAQNLINMAVEAGVVNTGKSEDAVNKYKEGQQELIDNVRAQWSRELKEDVEFGGARYPETEKRAQRVVAKYGDAEELRLIFNQGGIGDNPGLIKLFARIDKAMGEDQSVSGKPSGTKAVRSAADVMYGK